MSMPAHAELITCTYTGWRDLYLHMADLLALHYCSPSPSHIHPLLCEINTPLQISAWMSALVSHPDRAFASFVVVGIKEGFHIGFHCSSPFRATHNMHSAIEHPDVVQAYLDAKCTWGRMLGPFSVAKRASLSPCHINRLGVIPKGHRSGKWWLITDLSYPPRYSVNDGILPELCSLTYTSVERVLKWLPPIPPGHYW